MALLWTPTSNRGHIIYFSVTAVVLLSAIMVLIVRDIGSAPTIIPTQFARVVTTTPVPTDTATSSTTTTPTEVTHTPEPSTTGTQRYIEVTSGCAEHFEGECLLVRSGPGVTFPVVSKLRNGLVLKISETITADDGRRWHKIVFDEWLRYPERVKGNWYVVADYVTVINDNGDEILTDATPTSTKRIIVDRSEQKLYAYDGDELFTVATTSTGLNSTPTPRGVFKVYKKTPSRYMQGPLPNIASDDYYDLPGVPWNLYFTDGGAVIHGAYWHNKFGTQYSHGCVNLEPTIAHIIYNWAELNTTVTVKD